MIIRCYGARGSIPVSGKQYMKYGGNTTCIEIRSKNDEIIIIDAGSGIRQLGKRLLKEQRLEYILWQVILSMKLSMMRPPIMVVILADYHKVSLPRKQCIPAENMPGI